jgi:hypothetical protein
MARGQDGGVRAFAVKTGGSDGKLGFDPKSGGIQDEGGSIWDLTNGRCVVGPRRGKQMEAVTVTPVYWFAWSDFYPKTQVTDQPSTF